MSGLDPPQDPTWSVGELHEALNGVLVHVFGDEVWVEGELRNFKRSQNQHVYFDLVDPDADSDINRPMLAVTLFARERAIVNRFLTRQGGAVRMGDGIRVRIRGTLNVYPARSTLQLRMTWIDPAYTLGVLGQERDRVLAALVADGVLRANAQVELPVDHERGRLEVRGRGVRRILRELLGLVPVVEEALGLRAIVRADLREEVVDRGVGDQRLERMRAP